MSLENGDDAAGTFEALVLRYETPVLNLIRQRFEDIAAAEDLTMDVFLRAYRSFPDRSIGEAGPWLAAIARDVCQEQLQKLAE
jgi:DNA-directed RNA polymerase specialized sigma24 family protein